jgi:methionyl-tRNA formyltransferase
LKILFVGGESAGIKVLRTIAHEKIKTVVAVLTSPPGRNDTIKGGLWNVAESLGFPALSGHLVRQPAFAAQIKEWGIDILISVHSPFVVCNEVLQAPTIGCYNLHPGTLPQYAGLNPVSWALYNGETQSAVTIHSMTRAIDGGHIIYQHFFPIESNDAALTLMAKCVQFGVPLVIKLLKETQNSDKKILGTPQDSTKRRYYDNHIPQNGLIDWNKSAQEVFNFVRACDFGPYPSPWGKPYSFFENDKIEVLKARPSQDTTNELPGSFRLQGSGNFQVSCKDRWLEIEELKWEGNPADIAAGYPAKGLFKSLKNELNNFDLKRDL